MSDIEVSVVMPCLNEEKTLAICIQKAQKSMADMGVVGEVVIADNGSTDGSQDIARSEGARVVDVEAKGYGSALRGGIEAAYGTYVIMGDSDDSYDFTNLRPFIEQLREGYDLVMGNRFRGGIAPGAMPPLHKYLGNPVLTFIGRVLFNTPSKDFHCGLRGFSKEAYARMDVRTTGMEFASEIVVKASLFDMKITEVATTLQPDGRDRAPHLRSWRDGWRHLRFLLMFSPRWLFVYPGALMAMVGVIVAMFLLFTGSPRMNSLILSMALIIMGLQSLSFAAIVRTFAVHEGLLPAKEGYRKLQTFMSLEKGVFGGLFILIGGVIGILYSIYQWSTTGFDTFPGGLTDSVVLPSAFALVIGIQLIFNAFVLSVISLEHIGSKKSAS